MKVLQIAPFNNIQFDLWYCPYPIGTWISTQSIAAVLFVIASFVVSAAIWYPFFKTYEKQLVAEEAEKEAENEAKAAKKAGRIEAAQA